MAIAVVTALAWCAQAQAALQTNGIAVSHFATGFATCCNNIGPLGVAFDQSNRLYVVDLPDSWLYRFDKPGIAGPSTRVGSAPMPGKPEALAFDGFGRLYVARAVAGDVVEVNPDNGQVIRTVATGLPCAGALAADPLTGDLFVDQPGCQGGGLHRISNPASATPGVEPWGGPWNNADGITLAPDGTLYVVDSEQVFRVTGPGTGNPGQKTLVANVAGDPDGIAIGVGGSGQPPYLILNRNDGVITRLDLTGGTPSTTNLMTGGTRGDFIAVGFDGCLYATQSDEVLKITDPSGTCGTQGGSAGLGAGLLPTTPAQNGAAVLGLPSSNHCVDRRRFSFKLHHARGVPVVAVDVYVNGKRKVRLHGKSISRVTIKRLPQKKFRVRIVARQASGSALISTRTYVGCSKTRPRTRRHRH